MAAIACCSAIPCSSLRLKEPQSCGLEGVVIGRDDVTLVVSQVAKRREATAAEVRFMALAAKSLPG